MTKDSLNVARTLYQQGQDAFAGGRYREAVEQFEQAVALAQATTSLGGEIQTWLVNAYSALDRETDAIALCEVLSRHPDLETRKQGKALLYILQAPKLKRPSNWMTQIPDLGNIAEDTSSLSRGSAAAPIYPSRSQPQQNPVDPSQINRQDNGFLWVALTALALLLGGVLWLSQ
ncbi:MAG: tetratricopeptide repeat protein [Nodosilinea sp. LVE1205-7]